MFKILNESLQSYLESCLVEDIEAVKRQYSHIPENDFYEIIELDPTYDSSKDSVGKYSKWLLGLYKKDNPLNYEKVELQTLLTNYDKAKNDRKVAIEKDINKFKSISDMNDAVSNAGEAELSKRQKERELRTSKDYKEVYKDKDWTIYTPLTYAGSCTLGKGTHWCTAYSDDDSYYEEYTEKGPLYILINNKNPTEKYQFHFETDIYMDKDDDKIDLIDFYNTNPNIKRFFIKIGKEYDISKPFIYTEGYVPERISDVVEEIIIKDGVTHIPTECFMDCYNLKKITIPNSVTDIGIRAFSCCRSLTSLVIPDSVKYIGSNCFEECTNLTSIKLSSSLTHLLSNCFYYCESLEKLVVPRSVQSISNNCFTGCYSLRSLTIYKETNDIEINAFSGTDDLTLYVEKGSQIDELYKHYHQYFPDMKIKYI